MNEQAQKKLFAYLDARLKQTAQQGKSAHLGMAIIDMTQAGELKHQLGDGTFELVVDEFFTRLQEFARGDDKVVQLGSHRGLVIMTGLTSHDHLELASAKLNRLMTPPIEVVNSAVLVKVQAGFAITTANGMSGAELYQAAHSALESARPEQRYVIYNPQSLEEDTDRWQLKTELEQALHQGEMFPYFEPVKATNYNTITHGAAHSIWHSPSRGVVPYAKIASHAKDADLSRPLAWQFAKASVAQTARWDRSIGLILPMPEDAFADDEVVQELQDALAIYDLEVSRLTVEVPEAVVADRIGRQLLGELRKLGMSVRVNPLGVGGLPLGALAELPVDDVVLDQTVMGKQTPPKVKQSIFQLIRTVGPNLNAVSVRDDKLARRLKDLGFTAVQGPAVGSVMRSDDFLKWLRTKVGAVG